MESQTSTNASPLLPWDWSVDIEMQEEWFPDWADLRNPQTKPNVGGVQRAATKASPYLPADWND